MTARDADAFARLVEALRPWLGEVVFVGGWAHRLYRLHPLAQPVDYPPLFTLDADVAVPVETRARKENIRTRLLAADFHETLSGEHRPPVARYELGAEYGGSYAEFLTTLVGGEHKRDKTPDATVRVAGITAQKLRHVDLLLRRPWPLRLERTDGFTVSRPATVRVPNAASYLAQKVLVHAKRKPAERAKDVLYIHDTIEVFGRSLAHVNHEWREHVRAALPAAACATVERAAEAVFGNVTDAVSGAVREAEAAGRPLTSRAVLEVCQAGLRAVFG